MDNLYRNVTKDLIATEPQHRAFTFRPKPSQDSPFNGLQGQAPWRRPTFFSLRTQS
jgi:hypothetical protein